MADPTVYPERAVIVRLSYRDVDSGETSVASTSYTPEVGASSITRLDLLEMASETLTRQLAEDLHLHRYAAQAQRELEVHDELRGE